MRSKVVHEVAALRNRVRIISTWANDLMADLTPTEYMSVGEELRTVSDATLELFYLLSETVDNINEEE